MTLERILILALLIPGIGNAQGSPPGIIKSIKSLKIADVATRFGTFQSHNQKIVENQYGIFMTYLHSEDETNLGTWRLARSIDGGKSFGTIYLGTDPTKAPVLETDSRGAIYLIHSDNNQQAGNAYFYRFDPEKNFLDPFVTTIPQGSAGKFASYFDHGRQLIYYATFWDSPVPNFYVLDADGNIQFTRALTLPGATSRIQYPHLEMDGPRLFIAWTTAGLVGFSYPTILYVYSDDGGSTWRQPGSGAVLSLPFVGDETGPARRITLDDELTVNTWLSNMVFKDGSLHFAYHANAPLNRQHYMRFEPTSGVRTLDIQPTWQGDDLFIAHSGGFFATDDQASAPLFMAGRMGTSYAVLKSNDSGTSWSDHAFGTLAPGYRPYALSGNRRLTRNGDVIGHYTHRDQVGDDHSVRFFRTAGEDRSSDPNRDWAFTTLDMSAVSAETGHAYIVSLAGLRHGGDTLVNGSHSRLRLFEDGVELGPAHTLHATIRASGGGLFSHWNSNLYFSSSDNTDPRTNGRTYQFAIPTSEALGIYYYGRIDPAKLVPEQGLAYTFKKDYGTVADSLQDPTRSALRLYEDGVELGPAHSLHADIRSDGGGRYSHWNGRLYMSSSDGSDPRTNGRNYTYRIEPTVAPACGTVRVEDAIPESGYAYILSQDFGVQPDMPGDPQASPLRLFEGDLELGPAHTLHATIRASGGGAFSHWNNGYLYFSTSDNTDPRTNGRNYSFRIEPTDVEACGTLFVENASPESGYAFILDQDFGIQPDMPGDPQASPLRLFENGVELGPAHTLHATIRAEGGGTFSHWNNGYLYFSTSDNTDPRTNGRIYTWAIR